MVYYTGDIHGDKGKIEWLCEQEQMTADDIIRILEKIQCLLRKEML